MAEQLKKTDVVIIGLGAAGGIAAYVLTQAGLSVVGLEAGGRLTGRDEKPNELAQSGRGYNVFGQAKANLEIPTWRPNTLTPSVVASKTWAPQPMMNAVGGSSIHYGTMSLRLSPWNFTMRRE